MKKICYVATIPAVVRSFLGDQIQAISRDWEVVIISHSRGAELLEGVGGKYIPLLMERKVSPFKDLLALIRLWKIFRRERFDLVHSIMPKAGLLAMLAAKLAGVRVRVHTFTGQVWANKRGWKRSILKIFDKLIVLFSTHILVDSPSQRDFLVAEGVLPQGKGIVIGHGSICGVDAGRFHPDAELRATVREELGIGLQQVVVLFLGRLNRDKGILDLAAAFSEISRIHSEVVLVLIGAEEDVHFSTVQKICGEYQERLRRVSFTSNPERYMAMADIFCLPSYREGFGQVIIEAAAAGVPTVATRIYGITDAVEDGKTGLLFPPGDIAQLTNALLKLIENQTLRQAMGVAAKVRVLELFNNKTITQGLICLYEEARE